MKLNWHFGFPAVFLLTLAASTAGVIDRVAIVIDKTVITESEVLEELRLTDLINGQPLDLGPAARRAAGDRLVDQELIRRELENGAFPKPTTEEGETSLSTFRQQRFHTAAEYQAALKTYGVTEDELKKRLIWQLTAIRFTDVRFKLQLPEAGAQSADRAVPEGAAASASVDQQMDAWLKQTREAAKIRFKPEAFQ